ncbi:uncharacterized protein LOC101853655 [Aplysia californica]|uniref:Uncharacterized protein LOC101853655 n=1 Tax=Aplysia californica TaxID=6500 RepID=A0ABM1ACD8_APLCA|nr:uncharacterized protein LOC101853655 [Aplysia californica]
MIPLAVGILLVAASAMGFSPNSEHFDHAFTQFLRDNNYRGGAVAAMKDGRLLHARGYGRDRQGHEVTAHAHFQVSSIAKSLTAVAIMRLVQDGELKLDEKVFGEKALLSSIKPWRRAGVDPRLYEVTVEHLLRHGAGWDTNRPPLYDPMLNEVYLDRGHKVPNIARDMGKPSPLSSSDLISYVMSHPLAFTPGTNVAYSNMAYLVLGRVVEEASGIEYRDYVKKVILDPCGMWSTRLELADDQRSVGQFGDDDPSVYDLLDAVAVDSALGWYSNIYDLVRFARCTFQRQTVLDDRHLELLLEPLYSAPIQHNDSWHCAGFRTNTRGALWQDADQHTDDLVLYHDLNPYPGTKHAGLPDTWVVMLYDKNINHIRHYTRELMALLGTGREGEGDGEEGEVDGGENRFLYDLSELHKHPMWEPWKLQRHAPEYCIRYRLDEHHLSAYVAAVRDEGFDLQWFTSYSLHGHTYFLLVSRRASRPKRASVDYIFQHGLTHRSLLKRKLQLEEMGYNLTQLHSYKSRSHEGDPASFAAVFRPDAFSVDTQMKYGTGHLPEPYEKLVQMYYEKKFYPISQTVVYHDKDEQFSFIFVKHATNDEERTDFKHYYDLSSKKLSKLTADNARANLRLTYLNSYDVAGKFKFSAIFTNGTHSRGLLEVEQPKNRATEITISNLKDGLVPRYIVPYVAEDKQFKLAIYYEELQRYGNYEPQDDTLQKTRLH